MEDQKIKEILIEKNDEFKEIYLKHKEFEEQLYEHNNKSVRTEKDLIEEQNIKKRKLKLKDKMQKHIVEFRKQVI